MKQYIDIGVNLTGNSFNKDREAVIERALEAGVQKLVVTGTNIEHSAKALALSEQYPGICYATVGLHPHHAGDYSSSVASELAGMLQHEQAVAVGECGLDFNRNYSSRSDQIRAFEAQLELAVDTQKPLFLHQRDAHEDFVAMIESCRSEISRAVAHCFTGTLAELQDYLQLDMHVGVTGWICDERRGQALQQAVKALPLEKLMLETDAPYLLPRDMPEAVKQAMAAKNRNEPCYLPHIAAAVAGFMGVDEDSLAQAAWRNSLEFFAIA